MCEHNQAKANAAINNLNSKHIHVSLLHNTIPLILKYLIIKKTSKTIPRYFRFPYWLKVKKNSIYPLGNRILS